MVRPRVASERRWVVLETKIHNISGGIPFDKISETWSSGTERNSHKATGTELWRLKWLAWYARLKHISILWFTWYEWTLTCPCFVKFPNSLIAMDAFENFRRGENKPSFSVGHVDSSVIPIYLHLWPKSLQWLLRINPLSQEGRRVVAAPPPPFGFSLVPFLRFC